jgi:Lrp/AsnC family leucine-responsive transcriptional regulator
LVGIRERVPEALDHTSLLILDLLARDGRISYQAIADEVGLSRPAVMERVKRLEEGGYVTGYHARLDRARLGRPVTAFVAVRYPTSSAEGEEPEILALADHPDVLECHHVAGDDCYMLKVAAPSLEKLEQVLRSLKVPERSVSTRTTIVLSTVFEKAGVRPVLED